jgi:hypothetical protein
MLCVSLLLSCGIACLLLKFCAQWLVVECPSPLSTAAAVLTSSYVLVLRGESLSAELFKKASKKIKNCHTTMKQRRQVQTALVVDEAVIRQLIAQYNAVAAAASSGAAPQLWVHPNAGIPLALTLYPIAEPSTSDSFVARLIAYHSAAATPKVEGPDAQVIV